MKEDQFPKLFNGSLHNYKNNQLLSVLIKNDKLTILIINKNNLVIEETFEPNMDACQSFDHNFISNK